MLETTSAVVGLVTAAMSAMGLIGKIKHGVEMATQNKAECDDLAGRLSVLHKTLRRLRLEGPEAAEALSGLCDALKEADELVGACRKWSTERKHAFSGDHAERFSKVNRRIDSHINLINMCLQVDRTHRLNQITPPASTSLVAADVYKERLESYASTAVESKAQGTRNRLEAMIQSKTRWKQSATGRIVRVTLGIVFLNPGYVVLAACGL